MLSNPCRHRLKPYTIYLFCTISMLLTGAENYNSIDEIEEANHNIHTKKSYR
jgi:hypothetical protein